MTRTTRTTRNRWLSGTGSVLAAVAVLAAAAAPAQADPAPRGTTQVSTGLNGAAPDSQSSSRGISADGHYALFTSWARNLVPQPALRGRDAYVTNLRNGRTERVNLSDSGQALDGFTDYVAINGDGRYVAFDSDADNVVPGVQVKGRTEVYLRDRKTGRTELVSGSPTGADTDRFHASYEPSLSADGRYVAFVSSRTDLDPTVEATSGATSGAATGATAGGDAPSLTRPYTLKYNIYLTDRRTHTTRLVSRDVNGRPGESLSVRPTISADGRTIGFSSLSDLLPAEQTPALAAPAAEAAASAASAASADVELAPSAAEAALHATPENPARPNLAATPTTGVYYTYDVATGKLSAASLDLDGKLGYASFDATISPDGRRAIYALPEPGGSTNGHRYHTVLHVRDLRTGTVTKVSGGLPGTSSVGSSDHGSITADNRWLYFASAADNLVPGPQHPDWDVYRQDLRTGRTERVATAPDGSPGNGSSVAPFVDASGDTVVFGSTSGNLVAGVNTPPVENSQVFAKPTGRHRGDGDDQGQNEDD
ncbi:PD40 domain-containing protein [Kitasatospora sp. SUK 42]|uniref:PD40 domain-containing protein n=1 Tax=Kitasatospora sp. SUK 42 TaxID=1588882 RepID=UPI0018C97D83|nr:PD40 domain-containing protein [Kitasatospora sp. SUK 42]MBV2153129.1 PD40 domain-containing protein [Kitasatospora sp. SUK 42]